MLEQAERLLNRAEANAQIDRYLAAIEEGKGDQGYQRGAVVDLRSLPHDKEVILVGDLHGRLGNLKKILDKDNNLQKLREGKAVLVILGDAVHREVKEYAAEMDSSIELMQFIMDLKIRNPGNVYYVLGNHDRLTPAVKFGVDQGALFEEKMLAKYGRDYVDKYQQYINGSPLLVVGNGFAAMHAGPVAAGAGKQVLRLDDIEKLNPGDATDSRVKQLLWNRYGDNYREKDVNIFLSQVIGQPGAQLIVGHSPRRDGQWHWQLALNHHVIFAGHDKVGYAVVGKGQVKYVECSEASAKVDLRPDRQSVPFKIEEPARSADERDAPSPKSLRQQRDLRSAYEAVFKAVAEVRQQDGSLHIGQLCLFSPESLREYREVLRQLHHIMQRGIRPRWAPAMAAVEGYLAAVEEALFTAESLIVNIGGQYAVNVRWSKNWDYRKTLHLVSCADRKEALEMAGKIFDWIHGPIPEVVLDAEELIGKAEEVLEPLEKEKDELDSFIKLFLVYKDSSGSYRLNDGWFPGFPEDGAVFRGGALTGEEALKRARILFHQRKAGREPGRRLPAGGEVRVRYTGPVKVMLHDNELWIYSHDDFVESFPQLKGSIGEAGPYYIVDVKSFLADKGKEVHFEKLRKNGFVLGRQAENTHGFSFSGYVSRSHLQIGYDEHGNLTLQDLRSANGTSYELSSARGDGLTRLNAFQPLYQRLKEKEGWQKLSFREKLLFIVTHPLGLGPLVGETGLLLGASALAKGLFGVAMFDPTGISLATAAAVAAIGLVFSLAHPDLYERGIGRKERGIRFASRFAGGVLLTLPFAGLGMAAGAVASAGLHFALNFLIGRGMPGRSLSAVALRNGLRLNEAQPAMSPGTLNELYDRVKADYPHFKVGREQTIKYAAMLARALPSGQLQKVYAEGQYSPNMLLTMAAAIRAMLDKETGWERKVRDEQVAQDLIALLQEIPYEFEQTVVQALTAIGAPAVPALCRMPGGKGGLTAAGILGAIARKKGMPEETVRQIVAALIEKMGDEKLHGKAAEELGTIAGSGEFSDEIVRQTVSALVMAVEDTAKAIRWRTVEALGNMLRRGRMSEGPVRQIVAALVAALKDENALLRRKAAEALMGTGALAAPELVSLLGDRDIGFSTRMQVRGALAEIGAPAAPELLRALEDGRYPSRELVAGILGDMLGRNEAPEEVAARAVAALAAASEDARNREVRTEAVIALGKIAARKGASENIVTEAVRALVRVSKRGPAAEALREVDKAAAPESVSALKDERRAVFLVLQELLAAREEVPETIIKETVPALTKALQDDDVQVQNMAAAALGGVRVKAETTENYVVFLLGLLKKTRAALISVIGALRSPRLVRSSLKYQEFYKEFARLNAGPVYVSGIDEIVAGEKEWLEPQGRTLRFKVKGSEGVYHFKHTKEGEVEELIKEAALLKAIGEGVIPVSDTTDIPRVLAKPGSSRYLIHLRDISQTGILYRAPEEYFVYITQDLKINNRVRRKEAVARGLSRAMKVTQELWSQGIFRIEDMYHRDTREYDWVKHYPDARATGDIGAREYESGGPGSLQLAEVLGWIRYPNISTAGLRDYGHYYVEEGNVDYGGLVNKTGIQLVYFTVIAAAAFYNNHLKMSEFKAYIGEQYRRWGVEPYGGFADEFWQLVQNDPKFIDALQQNKGLGTRGLLLKTESWDAIARAAVNVILESKGMSGVFRKTSDGNPFAEVRQANNARSPRAILPENLAWAAREVAAGRSSLAVALGIGTKELVKSLFDPRGFIVAHADRRGPAAVVMAGLGGSAVTALLLGFAVPLLSPLIAAAVGLACLAAGAGANYAAHVLLDMHYIDKARAAGLFEAINEFGAATMDSRGNVQTHIYLAGRLPGNAADLELRNTGMSVDGKTIWASTKQGALVLWAEGIDPRAVAQTVNEAAGSKGKIDGSRRLRGRLKELFASMKVNVGDLSIGPGMIIDHADSGRKISYDADGTMVVSRGWFIDGEGNAAADPAARLGELMSVRKGDSYSMNRNFLYEPDLAATYDQFRDILDKCAGTENLQISVKAELFRGAARETVRKDLARARRNGTQIIVSFDGEIFRQEAPEGFRDMGFAGYEIAKDAREGTVYYFGLSGEGLPCETIRARNAKDMESGIGKSAKPLKKILQSDLVRIGKHERSIVGTFEFLELFRNITRFYAPAILTERDARNNAYGRDAGQLPPLPADAAGLMEAIENGRVETLEAALGTGEVGVELARLSGEIGDAGRLRQLKRAFLTATVERMLIRDKLAKEYPQLAQAYERGDLRFKDPRYEEMLGRALLESRDIEIKGRLSAEEQEAKLLQENAGRENQDQLLEAMFDQMNRGKPQAGSVAVVIDIILSDINAEHNLRNAPKKRNVTPRITSVEALMGAA